MTAAGGGGAAKPVSRAEGDAARVRTALGYDPADIDTLAQRCALSVDLVSVALVELELAGEVASLPGGLYQRLR